MTRRLIDLPRADLDDDVRMFDLDEVGQRLGGMSSRTVRRLIASGELVAVLVGDGEGVTRVRVNDLRAYMESLPRVPARKAS